MDVLTNLYETVFLHLEYKNVNALTQTGKSITKCPATAYLFIFK